MFVTNDAQQSVTVSARQRRRSRPWTGTPSPGHRRRRRRRRAPAGPVMAAVDPYRRQVRPASQARGHGTGSARRGAACPLRPRAAGPQPVARRSCAGRLVGADVLRGHDAGEARRQAGACEPANDVPVNVGQDDQLVLPSQQPQRGVRVVERRPVGHGAASCLGVLIAHLGAEFGPQPAHARARITRV